jgi:hypothetical protein
MCKSDKLEDSGDIELLLDMQKLPITPKEGRAEELAELTSTLDSALDDIAQLRSDRAVLAVLTLMWLPKNLHPNVLPADCGPMLQAIHSAAFEVLNEGSDHDLLDSLLSCALEVLTRIDATDG